MAKITLKSLLSTKNFVVIFALLGAVCFGVRPCFAALPPAVAGEGKFITINLKGFQIQDGYDVSLTSSDPSISSVPQTIGPSNHYRFNVDGTVHGTGYIASIFPAGSLLSTSLEELQTGFGKGLRGAVFISAFADTYPLLNRDINGGYSALSVTGRIESGVENGVANFSLKNFSATIFGAHQTQLAIVFDDVWLVGQSADIIKSDIDFDASADLLLLNSKKKTLSIGYMNGAKIRGSVKKGIGPALGGAKLPSGFSVAGIADFDLDGNLDLLLSNKGGQTQALRMDLEKLKTASVATSLIPGPQLPPGFVIGGVGDFNLDGNFDLLAYNKSTLSTQVFFLNQGMNLVDTQPGPAIPSGFKVVSVSDFNDDGHSDMLLFNSKKRTTQVITMDGLVATGVLTGPTLPKDFVLIGSSGFDNNRSIDLEIFNPSTREVKFYLAKGATFDTLPKKPSKGPILPEGLQLIGPR